MTLEFEQWSAPLLAVFLHKTRLTGLHTRSPGGFYAFDTLDNARRFVTGHFQTGTNALDVAYTTRLFDATVVEDASREMRSPFA